MTKRSINPRELFDSTTVGFSQLVISQPGTQIFISGQVAWNENKQIVGKSDFKVQVDQSLKNLKVALRAAGADLEHVVMLRIYIVELSEPKVDVVAAALCENFGTSNPPASTWIHVMGLAHADFLVEIEAQAVLP